MHNLIELVEAMIAKRLTLEDIREYMQQQGITNESQFLADLACTCYARIRATEAYHKNNTMIKLMEWPK